MKPSKPCPEKNKVWCLSIYKSRKMRTMETDYKPQKQDFKEKASQRRTKTLNFVIYIYVLRRLAILVRVPWPPKERTSQPLQQANHHLSPIYFEILMISHYSPNNTHLTRDDGKDQRGYQDNHPLTPPIWFCQSYLFHHKDCSIYVLHLAICAKVPWSLHHLTPPIRFRQSYLFHHKDCLSGSKEVQANHPWQQGHFDKTTINYHHVLENLGDLKLFT